MVKVTNSQTLPLLGLLVNRLVLVRVCTKYYTNIKITPKHGQNNQKMGKNHQKMGQIGKKCLKSGMSQTLPLLGLLVDWLAVVRAGQPRPPSPTTATNHQCCDQPRIGTEIELDPK